MNFALVCDVLASQAALYFRVHVQDLLLYYDSNVMPNNQPNVSSCC